MVFGETKVRQIFAILWDFHDLLQFAAITAANSEKTAGVFAVFAFALPSKNEDFRQKRDAAR